MYHRDAFKDAQSNVVLLAKALKTTQIYIDRRVNELWYICTVENSVVVKMNKLKLLAIWLNLRNFILTVHCILMQFNLHVS